ncbi:MAG TPA: hypothetical protein PL110_06895 [Candidatus Eremiobacteraeota bacterium]|nr:MAG: hypothetical protein BWY64_03359 [bacterium ADurb.Bin363]HPZ07821.1 hypothetical protein [Candidatus Eremiobacteraeota bacterium]
MGRDSYESEIEEYNDLLDELREVEGLRLDLQSSMESLAFLIEEMKKKNPGNWQRDLGVLKRSIYELNEKEGKGGVSFLLTRKINSIYIDFLNKRKEQVKHNKDTVSIIETMKEMTEESTEFAHKSYEHGQAVIFGGVSTDYIPEWYKYVKE